jgi:hypothetical protein
MPERRIKPRLPCFLKGEIILDNGARTVPCEAHDISDKGLRLEGADFSQLPDTFILAIPRRQFRERVQIVRQLEKGVGVKLA